MGILLSDPAPPKPRSIRKRLLLSFTVIFLGSIITTVVDHYLLGTNLSNISTPARMAHQAMYMLWGAILVWRPKS
ncbi:hypothetical protein A2635_03020 [Candidatus Peribacteria bacterium RIFCSPHIGHO2_01_FULL_51_9]|nr:MAG: hypothetical protein A2635_03020 [Candidatus Peribacteria bacterium RIFCSPHIGHO2_01_FULL_51_9]